MADRPVVSGGPGRNPGAAGLTADGRVVPPPAIDPDAWLDDTPLELVFAAGAWPRRQARASRRQLLETLASHGVTEQDYQLVEHARELVQEVNQRLARRGSALVYAVTLQVSPEPVHPPQRLEERPGDVPADQPATQCAVTAFSSRNVAHRPLSEVQAAPDLVPG